MKTAASTTRKRRPKNGLVDIEMSESESSYLNASNLDESDNKELIEACGCQYASY